jgi:hypothetical protein
MGKSQKKCSTHFRELSWSCVAWRSQEDQRNAESMDDDIIRIIISTDNHLGFAYKDPIRCDDCFASFEEVFIAAKEVQHNPFAPLPSLSPYLTHSTLIEIS